MNNARLAEITKLIGAVTALILAIMGAVSIFAGNPAGVTTDTTTVAKAVAVPVAQTPVTETKVDTSAAPGKQSETVTTSEEAAKAAASSPELVQGGGLRDEVPPGVTADQAAKSLEKQEQLANNDQLPIVQPAAAPEQRGCASRFVVNYSSRRGVAPREWTLHYTVSHNVLGWSDVDAIVNLFNTPSDQASSNYVIDSEGHCAYIVRESDKAWTQAGGNPYSISVEVVAYGTEPVYLQPAGLRKLAMVISDSAKRWNIPITHGAVSNCIPTRPGIIQHKDWGACGGGHFDISPFSVDTVIHAVEEFRASEACNTRCHRVKDLRAKHQRTHQRFVKNHCARRGPHGQVRHGYCDTLRNRNKAVHLAAKVEHISLAGTFQ